MDNYLGPSSSTARTPTGSALVGIQVCYRPNEGRPGVFRVNELTSDASQGIKIGFTIWNAP